MELENIVFSLQDVCSDLTNLFSTRIDEKGLKFIICKTDNLPRFSWGDPLRLNQVLINLLSNAIKFTEEGSITLKVTSTPDDDEKDILLFQVIDTGIGISQEAIAGLFLPFTQADPSITRRYGGTGLGLVLCRKLLELMGGTIWCESTVGEGSNFVFTLPLERLSKVDMEKVQLADRKLANKITYENFANRLQGFRILLAEDNDLNQMVLKEILKKINLGVTIVENGYQVLETLKKEEFDIILMDVQMPEMDGLTATRMIREQKRFDKLPIIAMTAHAMTGDSEKSFEAGMNEHITKPISPKVLFECLLKWKEMS